LTDEFRHFKLDLRGISYSYPRVRKYKVRRHRIYLLREEGWGE
jgi:hypothetical protein